MHWNYRMVNIKNGNGGDPWIQICEVYYNDDGSLMGYSESCIGSETVTGLNIMMERVNMAMSKPVIDEDDFKGETK